MLKQEVSKPVVDNCPPPMTQLIMNIMVWNCRGALSPNFSQTIIDMVKESSLDIFIVTETRVGGDRAKEIFDKLSFDGAIHTDTLVYTGGLWILWYSDIVKINHLASIE